MANNIIPEDGAHWYTRSGMPMHEVPMKTKPGEFRATTIADAAEHKLLPSVTSITRVLHRPALQAWIVDQYMMAALTLPDDGRSADERARAVVRDAEEQVRKASSFGSRIHSVIELYLKGDNWTSVELLPSDYPFVAGIVSWLTEHPLKIVDLEFSFANPELGYGGRVDCIAEDPSLGRIIIDWKTQQTPPDKTKKGNGGPRQFRHYPEHGIQLAGYSHGIQEPDLPCVNILISSTHPGYIEPFTWFPDDWRWDAFNACKFLWYSPAGPGHRLADPNYQTPIAAQEEDISADTDSIS